MNTRDRTEFRYRLGEETYSIIKHEIVPWMNNVDSVPDFTRWAIRNQAREIGGQAQGGRQAKRLIRLLSDIRGIDEEVPECKSEAGIKEETLDKSLTVTIPYKYARWVTDITDETTLKPSNAIQYCIFKQLAVVVEKIDTYDGWKTREILRTWTSLKTTLIEPKLHLLHVFAKRFVHQYPETRYLIQHDPQAFEDFAEAYKTDFYRTEYYDELKNLYGDRTLTNVENVIEEHSNVSLDVSDESDWLAELVNS